METKDLINELKVVGSKLKFFEFPIFTFGDYYYEIKWRKNNSKYVIKTMIRGSFASEVVEKEELTQLVLDLKSINVVKEKILCAKRKYETKSQADTELRRILETNYKPWKTKKPTRIYFCKHCNSYHLTSQLTFKN